MSTNILLSALSVLVLSLIIAKHAQLCPPQQHLKNFLFGGNNPTLATASNAGSILSIAIIFSVYFVGIMGYGLITAISTITGLFFGYLGICYCIIKITRLPNYYPEKYKNTTLVDLIENKSTTSKYILKILIILQYLVAIVSEFGVLIAFLVYFTDSDGLGLSIATIIALLCALYTSVGGYSGVLRTDFFQLLVYIATCLYFIFALFPSKTLEITLNNLNGTHFSDVSWLPPFTYALMTAAAFCAFPDIWIRNMSSLSIKRKSNGGWVIKSFFLLILIFTPILVLGLVPLETIDKFDKIYDVPRVQQFYAILFTQSSIIQEDPIAVWFVISSFICAFVTTIDTWLIGVLQHLQLRTTEYNANVIKLMPFLIVFVSLIIANYLEGIWFVVTGLFLFPFLFFNTLVFFTETSRFLKTHTSPKSYIFSLILGLAFTGYMIKHYFEDLGNFAPETIFYTAIIVYSSYIFCIATKFLFVKFNGKQI